MKLKVKKIIAREGLIIISILVIAAICLKLNSWQSSKFNRDGFRSLNSKSIQEYNLFVRNDKEKSERFDLSTAIPVATKLNRNDYIILSKQELLNRKGFYNLEWVIIWDDDLEKRFGTTKGKEVEQYFKERDILKNELKYWSNSKLASMAVISIDDFYNSIVAISHLTKKIDYSSIGLYVILFVYPIYLIFLFIRWAIKTLLKKE